MARIQPVLTEAENALVDQMASLTRRHRPSGGLYKSGRARDPLSGHPVLSRHRGR